jgi:hypothetical protein
MNYWTQSTTNVYVAAHRGWCEKYPENTMEAFRAAVQSGRKEDAYAQLGRLHTLLSAEDPFWITAEHQMARLERLS